MGGNLSIGPRAAAAVVVVVVVVGDSGCGCGEVLNGTSFFTRQL